MEIGTMLVPKIECRVSVEEYLKITSDKNAQRNIKSSRFVPPKLGTDNYGYFEIQYKTPVLVEK